MLSEGYRYDEVTGLYYLQSRYYNPEIGRFVTRDSFEGFEDEPLSLNKYAYVHNSPVMSIDPDGFKRFKKCRVGKSGYASKSLYLSAAWAHFYSYLIPSVFRSNIIKANRDFFRIGQCCCYLLIFSQEDR
ncbi:hypothetical protein CEN49_27750 [Fischerella thermalis CCMEE 5273]|nr:hypothetical protein CEN49_27750 [Fischerella thermalis CCMEE 5273]